MTKTAVPKTPIKPKAERVEFNIGSMVATYFTVVQVVQEIHKRADPGLEKHKSFFQGIMRGYEDWFQELKLDRDRVLALYQELDLEKRQGVRAAADKVIAKMEETIKPKLIIPGANPAEIAMITRKVKEGKG
jgi:hypothetical protein